MRIKMLSTQNGSLDGIRVTTYEDGKEYDLTGSTGARELAQAFVGARMASEVASAPAPSVSAQVANMAAAQSDARDASDLHPYAEEKAIEAAPENKMVDTGKRPYNRKAK